MMQKRTKRTQFRSTLQIRVLEDEGRSLTTELHKSGLEILGRNLAYNAADSRTPNKFNLTDGIVGDQHLSHSRSRFSPHLDLVQAPWRQSSLHKSFNNRVVGART